MARPPEAPARATRGRTPARDSPGDAAGPEAPGAAAGPASGAGGDEPARTDVVATDGRTIGRRAHLTRRRFLDTTLELLEEKGALDLKVIDIAREAGSSTATFYQYFEHVDAALLALSEEAGRDLETVNELARGEWMSATGLEETRRFAAAFIEYWDAHKAILRVRNLRSEEGDPRFRALRLDANAAIMAEFTAKIHAAQTEGRVSKRLNSYTAAGAMISVLERMAAFHVEFERRGVSRRALIETVARIVLQTLSGYDPL
jgi:AcrR family transcriptional regulator